MHDYIGDLFFGGFIIVMTVIFLRDNQQAVSLVTGLGNAYTSGVTQLSSLG
jgi:hypothetical protein